MTDDSDDVSRRSFLAAAAGVGGLTLALSTTGARLAFATPENPDHGDVLVVLFNRGGMDGLNAVAPLTMSSYRDLRPSIRVKDPGEFSDPSGKAGLPLVAGGAVRPFALSGTFGLHPGMDSIFNGAWAEGHLAIVHAAGLPASESTSRSHFECQRHWEAGSGNLGVRDGFLNRFLLQLPGLDRLAGLGRGNSLAALLNGAAPALAMNRINDFGVGGFAENDVARNALTSMYGRGSDVISRTGASTLDTVQLIRSLPRDPGVRNGATYGWDDLSTNLKEVARLIRAKVGLRAVAIDYGGWDTHNGQGVPEQPSSTFRSRMSGLANALQAFYQDLGELMGEVTLVSLSEFGRTIDENGSGGTDHGRATAMFVLGRKVRGGIYGDFPDRIEHGPEGDLAVLNDYRRVLSEVMRVRCGLEDLGAVFPTFTQQAPLGLAAA